MDPDPRFSDERPGRPRGERPDAARDEPDAPAHPPHQHGYAVWQGPAAFPLNAAAPAGAFGQPYGVPGAPPAPYIAVSSAEVPDSKGPLKQPPRPVNSFLIFSNQFRKILQEENKELNNAQISRLLGEKWRSLGKETKGRYEELARARRKKERRGRPPNGSASPWPEAAKGRPRPEGSGGESSPSGSPSDPEASPGTPPGATSPGPSGLSPQTVPMEISMKRRRMSWAGTSEEAAAAAVAGAGRGRAMSMDVHGLAPLKGEPWEGIPDDPVPPGRHAIPDYETRHAHAGGPAAFGFDGEAGPAYALIPVGAGSGWPLGGPLLAPASASSIASCSGASTPLSSAPSSRHASSASSVHSAAAAAAATAAFGRMSLPSRCASIAAPPPTPALQGLDLSARRASGGAAGFLAMEDAFGAGVYGLPPSALSPMGAGFGFEAPLALGALQPLAPLPQHPFCAPPAPWRFPPASLPDASPAFPSWPPEHGAGQQ
eukprot:tig00020911_g15767.t1